MNTNERCGWTDSPQRHLEPLRRYQDTVLRLFPEQGRQTLEGCRVSTADAIFLGYFLDQHPRDTAALEVSTCPGASAFWLASHPNVSKVICVNPNLRLSEAVGGLDASHGRADASPRELRALDIVSAALVEHPEERGKIDVVEGVIGDLIAVNKGLSGEEGLIALLEPMGSREDVSDGLAAVFRLHQRAVAFLGCCRGERGPFVQAGVADFLGPAQGTHRFRMVADLGPALASSGMGIVYPDALAADVEATLWQVARAFSHKLDPLRLLGREEELIGVVIELNRRLSETAEREERLEDTLKARLKEQGSRWRNKVAKLEAQIADLKAQIADLKALDTELHSRLSSRRYRLADALADRALRVPALKKLARKNVSGAGKD